MANKLGWLFHEVRSLIVSGVLTSAVMTGIVTSVAKYVFQLPAEWLALLAVSTFGLTYGGLGSLVRRGYLGGKKNQAGAAGAADATAALRALEWYYLRLALERDEVHLLVSLTDLQADPNFPEPKHFYNIEYRVERIRTELINLSPSLFPVSVTLEFQKPSITKIELKERVPSLVDGLMKAVLSEWQKRKGADHKPVT
ncbi:MAG: hypothetical protein Q7R30_19080 [Acidobacteriota bacterium]|nr:hypothetical protein [Acidobacteriota bacterium]